MGRKKVAEGDGVGGVEIRKDKTREGQGPGGGGAREPKPRRLVSRARDAVPVSAALTSYPVWTLRQSS